MDQILPPSIKNFQRRSKSSMKNHFFLIITILGTLHLEKPKEHFLQTLWLSLNITWDIQAEMASRAARISEISKQKLHE